MTSRKNLAGILFCGLHPGGIIGGSQKRDAIHLSSFLPWHENSLCQLCSKVPVLTCTRDEEGVATVLLATNIR